MDQSDPRLKALSLLVQLEDEARGAETAHDLSYVMVNDSLQVLDARTAVYWRLGPTGKPQIVRASHTSELDKHTPFVAFLEQWLCWLLRNASTESASQFHTDEFPDELRSQWRSFFPEHVLVIPLKGAQDTVQGGLLAFSDRPYVEAHRVLGGYISSAFSHAMNALETPRLRNRFVSHLHRYRWRYLLLIVCLFLIPVRQYALPKAEVVAVDPFVVASPITGVVEEVHVEPNQPVKEGDILFTLDDEELVNGLNVARKAYEVARAELLRNTQSAFQCEKCRAKVPELRAMVEREKAKVAWARSQLERGVVRAPKGGVAVFADPNEWKGRPVQVGERVMTLANPDSTRLEIYLNINDAIATDVGTEVVFYPNVSPLHSYEAEVRQTSYEAVLRPDKTWAYVLSAAFGETNANLGWRGTAKVYGDRVPLLYLMLRRPLSWLRRATGV